MARIRALGVVAAWVLVWGISSSAWAVTYVGEWNNTTFGSSGAVTFDINLDESLMQLSVSADFDGFVFASMGSSSEWQIRHP